MIMCKLNNNNINERFIKPFFMNYNMTKNNLVKKILNAGKKVALGTSLFALPLMYSNNVNAQVSTLNEKGSETATKVLQKDMLNAYDIPGYVIIDKTEKEGKEKPSSIETVRVYPTFSTMRGNNELIPRLVYSPVKAQVEGQDVDVIKYRADGKDKKNIEDLFAKKGEGCKLIRDKTTFLDGKIPVNTSGGLKAKGHPISATGLSQIYELTKQLRNEAGERQVSNPKYALSHNIGGAGSSSVVHILRKV